ncbi:hypothetical protein KHA80_03170 [Anaerobacillus sp. HL2]|nr:hypothetical protein KHA80_03170 [Anaerobacillus sp. HL2]
MKSILTTSSWSKFVQLENYHTAQFAIELGDDGLTELGIYKVISYCFETTLTTLLGIN